MTALNTTDETRAQARRPLGARPGKTERSRGQVLIVFVMAIFVFVGMVAIVIDISWYWVNSLRVQRAADAAALAGVVQLPTNPSGAGGAFALARAEAKKNGYDDALATISVMPVQDPPGSGRRLVVTVSAPVDMFFMRIFGITSIIAQRTSKAEFVLPVPMGSPENYYGVGFFEGLTGGDPVTDGPNRPTSSDTSGSFNQFTNRTNGYTTNDSYATGVVGTGTNGRTQAYGNFGLSVPGANTVTGIEIRLEAKANDPVGCRLAVEVSDDNGGTWSTTSKMIDLTSNDPAAGSWPILGGPTDLWGMSWTPADIANGRFKVRLRAYDPEVGGSNANGRCADTATVSVDTFNVTVYSTTPRVNTVLPVPDPAGGPPLRPQNIWGAMFTSGGVRENGDRYGPAYLGGGTAGAFGSANPNYDPAGYDYTVELTGGATNGHVRLFDPIFCATGDNGHSGSYGAGDHWTGHPPSQVTAPVAITYRLYDMRGSPWDPSDDGAALATLNYDPLGRTLGDFSGDFGTPANSTSANRLDCSTHAAHNNWVTLMSGLPQGMYRVNVNTTIDAVNLNVGAENLFSIHVQASGGAARVYGGGRMVAYTNMDTATGLFYLAQIEAVHASKQLEIKLFDPGESAGNAFLRIKSPDGNVYSNASFSWTSDDGRSGSGTQIQTSVGGVAQFNNRQLTITIPLSPTYGAGGLTPTGETEPGWWKIEYQMSQANDTTTWEVSIKGNPVHLIVP